LQVLAKASLPDAIAVERPQMTNTVGKLDVGSALLALWASKNLGWEALEAIPETSPALFRKDPDAERGKRFCMSGTILQIRAEKNLAGRVQDDRALPLIARPSVGMGAGIPVDPGTPSAPTDSASAGAGIIPDLLAANVDLTVPDDGKVYVAILQAKPETSTEGGRTLRNATKDLLVAEVIAVKSSGTLVDGSEARACGVLTGVTLPAADVGPSVQGDVTEHRIVGMFDLPENRGSGATAGR
jgi:hypothetical protein